MLNEDLKVRDYLKKKLAHASVGRVVIERPAKDARITIHSARPGVVIGKKGEDIEVLKAELRKMLGVQMVHVNIEEIRKPEIDAQLIADSIAQQLEKRIMFRRAMKRAMQNAMRLGAQGIKIASSGRLTDCDAPCCLRGTRHARPPELGVFEATSAFTHVTARQLAHHPSDGFVDGLQGFGFPPPCHPSYGTSGSCPRGTIAH